MREGFTLTRPSSREISQPNTAAPACRGDRCEAWREAVIDAGGESKLGRRALFLIERCDGQLCGLAQDTDSRVVTTAVVSEGVQYAQA